MNGEIKRTNIAILNIASGPLLGFDDLVCLFNEVLDEHLSCDCDDKCSIIGAVLDFIIGVNDFLYACH